MEAREREMETNVKQVRAELDFTRMLFDALEERERKQTEAAEAAEREKAEARAARLREEAEKLNEAEEIPAGFLRKWKTSAEEVAQINAGKLEAVSAFYFRNYDYLQNFARAFFYRHTREAVRVIVSPEDMLQQVYIDLADGLLKLRPYDKAIGRAVCRSFRYAAVGGIEEIYIPRGKLEGALHV